MARLTFPSCAGAAIGTKEGFILGVMISVMGCAAPNERPDDEASAEAALALPFLASTQAPSPFETDRIDPSLDDSLALIDQLTQDLVALTDEDEVYVMDEAAGLYIDQHLAETGILEGGFDLRHTDTDNRLIGDLTN